MRKCIPLSEVRRSWLKSAAKLESIWKILTQCIYCLAYNIFIHYTVNGNVLISWRIAWNVAGATCAQNKGSFPVSPGLVNCCNFETDHSSGLRALSLTLLDDVIPRRLFSVFVKRAQPWVLGQGAFLLRFDTHGVLGSHVVGGEMVRETRYLLVRNIPEKSTEESINHYFQRWVATPFVRSHRPAFPSRCVYSHAATFVWLWYNWLDFRNVAWRLAFPCI